MASIDLMLDEENELTFQLNIEGTTPGEASCRLLLDNENMSLVFEGNRNSNGELSVILPPLKHVLKEGTYDMSLEVIVNDKYFKPLMMEGNFEKSVTVTAIPATRKKTKKAIASASLLEVKKSAKTTKKPQKIRENKKNINKAKSNVTDEDILNIIKALSKN